MVWTLNKVQVNEGLRFKKMLPLSSSCCKTCNASTTFFGNFSNSGSINSSSVFGGLSEIIHSVIFYIN